jgi:hypothetical protein
LSLHLELADGDSSTQAQAQTNVQVYWYSHTYTVVVSRECPSSSIASSSSGASQPLARQCHRSPHIHIRFRERVSVLCLCLCLCLCQIVKGSCLRVWPVPVPVPDLSSPICADRCSYSCSSCDTRLRLVSAAPFATRAASPSPCHRRRRRRPPSPTHHTLRSAHSAAERASGAVRARTPPEPFYTQ